MALNGCQRVVVVVEMAEQQQTVDPLDMNCKLVSVQVGFRRTVQLLVSACWFHREFQVVGGKISMKRFS